MYGLETEESQAQLEHIAANPFDPTRDISPGFFSGAGEATIRGLGQSVAQVEALAGEGFKPIADTFMQPIDSLFATHLQEGYEEKQQAWRDIMRDLQPNPRVTGYLGNLLYGVSSVAPQATAGFLAGGPAGAAALVAAAQGNAAKDRAMGEGVDDVTAAGVGAIEGGTQAAGILLPGGFGGTLLKRIASGAILNTSMGAAQRGATGELLRSNGYKDMAEQYRMLEGAALVADAILGGGFGAMHAGAPHETVATHDPLPSDIDAALAAQNIHDLELGSAPGVPADLATRNSHVDAMNLATEQLLRGVPVNVSDVMYESNFVPHPENMTLADEVKSALNEQGYEDFLRETLPQRMEGTPNNTPLYVPVPKEPQRFISWIIKKGGIRDDGGDIRAAIGGVKGRPGFIRKNGIPADDITLMAHDAGYFFGEERPTINDVIEKINEDHNGNPQYSHLHENLVHDYLQALTHNVEIDRIAHDTGIDTKGKTHDQFWDEVTSHLSRERQAEEVRSMSDALEQEFADAEKAAKEWYESRGEAWEPDILDRGSPRTLEDLEHERRQEIAAREAAQGKSNDGATESAARDKGEVPGGVRQSGGASQPARRAGEGFTEGEVKSLVEKQAQAIAEKNPELEVATGIKDDTLKTTTARDALAGSKEAVSQTEKDASLFDVAINCFLGHGQ